MGSAAGVAMGLRLIYLVEADFTVCTMVFRTYCGGSRKAENWR